MLKKLLPLSFVWLSFGALASVDSTSLTDATSFTKAFNISEEQAKMIQQDVMKKLTLAGVSDLSKVLCHISPVRQDTIVYCQVEEHTEKLGSNHELVERMKIISVSTEKVGNQYVLATETRFGVTFNYPKQIVALQ